MIFENLDGVVITSPLRSALFGSIIRSILIRKHFSSFRDALEQLVKVQSQKVVVAKHGSNVSRYSMAVIARTERGRLTFGTEYSLSPFPESLS